MHPELVNKKTSWILRDPGIRLLPKKGEPKIQPVAGGESAAQSLFAWRRLTGLSRPVFAQIAHLSERTLAGAEKLPELPESLKPQITEARRLVSALLELIPPNELKTWLTEPNPGFDGQSPMAIIQAGEKDALWEMIHQTRQSAFG